MALLCKFFTMADAVQRMLLLLPRDSCCGLLDNICTGLYSLAKHLHRAPVIVEREFFIRRMVQCLNAGRGSLSLEEM